MQKKLRSFRILDEEDHLSSTLPVWDWLNYKWPTAIPCSKSHFHRGSRIRTHTANRENVKRSDDALR